MTTDTPTSPTDALAALCDGGPWRSRRDDRPVMQTLDVGLHLELPGPRTLARVWASAVVADRYDAWRKGSALLTCTRDTGADPRPHDAGTLADELRAAIAVLPGRDDAGLPYSNLRLFVNEAQPHTVAAYFRDVVAAVRLAAPKWTPPKDDRPALSDAERAARKQASKRDHMRRERADRRDASRDDLRVAAAWLAAWRDSVDPGTRIRPADLRAQYDDAAARADRDPLGRDSFYKVADEVLGPRVRRRIDSRPTTVYATPEGTEPMTRQQRRDLADLVVDRIAAEWSEKGLDGLADLITERQESHRDTGTDNVRHLHAV